MPESIVLKLFQVHDLSVDKYQQLYLSIKMIKELQQYIKPWETLNPFASMCVPMLVHACILVWGKDGAANFAYPRAYPSFEFEVL